MILPTVRSDLKAVESYQYEPGPALQCPMTVLTGDDDPKVAIEDASAWRGHTTGPFELRLFHGRHFFVLDHKAEIGDLISHRLRDFGAFASTQTMPTETMPVGMGSLSPG
jgi:surfactin synthase thioesterase subunit